MAQIANADESDDATSENGAPAGAASNTTKPAEDQMSLNL
jgi:DNA ligase (NAD+)